MQEPVRTAASGSRKARPAASRAKAQAAEDVKLPPELGIEQAGDLRRALLQRIDDARTVVFDAADVQRIHTAALQLFCLFCRDRRKSGREVRWQQPSAALRSAAALLGVTTLLQLSRDQT